ncbi:MAG: biosynthetic-type acetolactate synthase large subunit [Nitrososphaeria archaeon]|nr:biosynthetic-type acetolactate synthase large subunit [Nitrososphaeria archaeon]
MAKLSGAQALIDSLKKEGVEVVFGLPGGAILPVYDVLYDSNIRHVLVKHEQSAAHMADGYARVSGRPGVCIATSGPGATNLVTGIATAYMDSSPLIAITGQVAKAAIGKDAFQEADIIGITTSITKYNFQPRTCSEIPNVVKMAFQIATSGRFGPVLIDLPRDVQTEVNEIIFSDNIIFSRLKYNMIPHPLQVEKAVNLLLNAERPFILAGGGVIASNASQQLLALAELIMAPVATTLMGKGCFPENHPLSLGVVGMHGSYEANKLILEADVLLAVGCRFSDRTTCNVSEFCPDAKIIHVDLDASEIGKNRKVDVPIVGDAGETLSKIYDGVVKRLCRKEESVWLNRIEEIKRESENIYSSIQENNLTPIKILKELREILPNDTIVTTEVGQNQMWASLYFKALKPRTFITSGGLGTMGFGFPASLGAKVAKPDTPVLDIAGDGSFMMTSNMLVTSVNENIPVMVVILNNSMLGMVAQWQRLFYNRRYSAVKLVNPDFIKISEACGAIGIRVGSLEELRSAIGQALKNEVTTVIDIPISPEEDVFPMVPPGKGLKEMIYNALKTSSILAKKSERLKEMID